MTALVARVQGLGTRARRCRLWRHVVRRDSAVQEGLHEHTPARITSRRGSRHHGIDGGSLALGTTTTSMACIAACIACLCTAMATSYSLCTYSIIPTPSTHLLPHVAPPPAAPIPLHHTDSVCFGIQWLGSQNREAFAPQGPSSVVSCPVLACPRRSYLVPRPSGQSAIRIS